MRRLLRILLLLTIFIFIVWIAYHFFFQKGSAQNKSLDLKQEESNTSNPFESSSTTTFNDSNTYHLSNSPIPDEKLLPVCTLKGQLISHEAYELYYVNDAEEAAWVAYTLTDNHLNGPYHRSNNFEIDPLVKGGSASNEDYSHTGYDRGHLAPAGDFSWSNTAMQESFYYSNMTPQDPSFNRGKWKELEKQVRLWAEEYHTVTVFTGPVLTNTTNSIGPDKVIVPKLFYKVILTYINEKPQVIGFLMENHALHDALPTYAVSIDKIEQMAGLNFLEGMPDSIENKLEANVNIQQWDFVNKVHHNSNSQQRNSSEQAVICKGITKAGNHCKNHTKNVNGYCQHHQSQAQ